MATLTSAKPSVLDLSHRSLESEWLDSADLHSAALEPYLRDLARFNRAMLGHWPIISWLRGVIGHARKKQPLTLMDVGCGYGDLLRAIRRWSRRRGQPLRLIGLDLSAESICIARAATDAGDEIDYYAEDIFKFHPPVPVDIAVSSLLTHHLSDDMLVKFLRRMEAMGRLGWLIYDLQRHAVPFHVVKLVGQAARLHPMVIQDGRISVARSLTRGEWNERIVAAGIPRDTVRLRWFLYRFVISRLNRDALRP